MDADRLGRTFGRVPSVLAARPPPVLCELRVENLLLIERAELQLAPGLNVLTGETGAGKTVLAQALDLIMGGPAHPGPAHSRARARIVRPGCDSAYVEGVFAVAPAMRAEIERSLPETLRDEWEGEELILARRVGADGRTRAYVNGRAASVSDLRELGARAISFYGQHEHRKLVLAAAQLEMLDEVCHRSEIDTPFGAHGGISDRPAHAERLRACAASHREIVRLEAELARLTALGEARESELDLLEHELAEIDAVEPDEQEHATLLARRERLRGVEALRLAAAGASESLTPESPEASGAAHLLAAAAASLQGAAGVDAELDALATRCQALSIEAEDLAGALRSYGEGLEAEEGSLRSVEERLAAVERLTRKHGGTISAVLAHAEQARARTRELTGAELAEGETAGLLAAERQALEGHLAELRSARRGAATRLSKAVREQLAALAMPDASFEIELTAVEPRATGADAVEFVIAPNPGVAAAPLREIASGGELSRVMLALASACEQAGGAPGTEKPTLVFDEIDAGIGGHTARAVGERLQALARGRQVVCITHLPQIASLAARHFSVAKDTAADLTLATVTQLAEREVEGELVRMLGAEQSDAGARRHARELRRAA
jgi:DNA repair protein RecN (Recombination protein N)